MLERNKEAMNQQSEMECPSLPNPTELSSSILQYLDENLKSYDDLAKAPDLASQLTEECQKIDESLHDVHAKIAHTILDWTRRSQNIGDSLRQLSLEMRTDLSHTILEGKRPRPFGRNEQTLVEELPALAREVARVEKVRIYAETTLKLEALVGDLEDAVSGAMAANSRKHSARKILKAFDSEVVTEPEEKHLMAIRSLKDIEDILAGVAKFRPQWSHLVTAVDVRVDRAIAVLRPIVIADYRTLLTSLGWPPSLATTNVGINDQGGTPKLSNPLFEMHGNVKKQYGESFLALSTLQSVLFHRKARQLDQFNQDSSVTELEAIKNKLGLHETLWSIEELVSQIASRAEYHFSKWTAKPEFIFALGYRVTQEFVDTVDNALQPLLDKAKLVGYSAREEWVSAMVSMISEYLERRVFPDFVTSLVEKASMQARHSWLHLIDLIIAFDRQMQVLVVRSGTGLSGKENTETLGVSANILELRISCISVFCHRSDWLELWVDTELKDAQEKLKGELETERAWTINTKADFLSTFNSQLTLENAHTNFVLSTREDYKAPSGAESVIAITWAVVNRCRTLPDAFLRFKFVRSAAAPILSEYLDLLLQRCQEAEALTALADDEAMAKVALSINAARYCEYIVKEWCEDVFFLELQLAQQKKAREETGTDIMAGVHSEKQLGNIPELDGSVFDKEIENFKQLQTEWLAKLMTVILRGFDARCRDYVRNKKQWQEKVKESAEEIKTADGIDNGESSEVSISSALVDALDVLQGHLKNLKQVLNDVDFMDLWRSLASGLDQFLFSNIPSSNAKFSNYGVRQFEADMHALFQVFKPFCARPTGFFPLISDSLRLLAMPSADVKHVQKILRDSSSAIKDDKYDPKLKCLRQYGIRKISAGDVEKILKQRILMG